MAQRARRRAATVTPDGSPASAVRRAPFADNPTVGARGQQAQQRILDAALKVFGEVGYHQCKVQRITELAGCSRVSFYQYFSSKEDLFRHLAGRVARALGDSVEQLGPVTPDERGVAELTGWFERYASIYAEHQPVFVAFQTAASSDAVMAEGGQRIGARSRTQVRARVEGSPLDGAALDDSVRTILEMAVGANRQRELIAAGTPPVDLSASRLNRALADVSHRALFGALPGVNLRSSPRRPRVFPLEALNGAGAGGDEPVGSDRPGPAGMQTRAAVLSAAHDVYVERGYYGTRVDDIAAAAGVSHGVFYRYFRNKDELFRLLATTASQRFTGAYDELGDLDPAAPTFRAQLDTWLRGYAETCAEAAAIMRAWADAITRDPRLGSDAARAIRSGCRGVSRLLAKRGAGDTEAEAVVMLVLLDAMTSGRHSQRRVDRAAGVIERGLLLLP